MKKVILVASMLLISSTSMVTFQSCSAVKAVTTLSSGNVGTVAKSLMNVLTPKLGLSTDQSPKVSGLLTNFLTDKVNIAGLLKTDPTTYASKFGGLQGKLVDGLKGVLAANQVANLLNLKPATNDPKNVLSNLFY